VELTPANPIAHLWLAYIEFHLGNHAEALRELGLTEQLLGENRSFVYLPELAYAYSRLGRREDAARIFAEIEAATGRTVGAGVWAMAYLAVGDSDAARAALEEALGKIENGEPDEGFYNLMNLRLNCLRDPVLEQPVFVGLRERLRGR